MSRTPRQIGVIVLWGTGIAGVLSGAIYPSLTTWRNWDDILMLIIGGAVTLSIASVGANLAAGTRDVSRTEVRRVGNIVEVGSIIQKAAATEPPGADVVPIGLNIDGERVIVGLQNGAELDTDGIRALLGRHNGGAA